MSTPAWTPGPWHRFRGEINASDGLTVARFVEFVPEHRAQSDANANLIASAPVMVEALRELIDHAWQMEKDATEVFGVTFCGESLPLCNARAALAKARGQ